MGNRISLFVVGLLFGFGLALAGMTDPNKVLAFLDVAGDWDPSLLLVLGGAVGVTVIVFPVILRQPGPLLEPGFKLPTAQDIDGPLVVGAIFFGMGWGISGYCPGPIIASLAAPNGETWIVLPAMLLGAFLHRLAVMAPHDTARSRSRASEKNHQPEL
jgi:uncharacterized membrane protein YedE/YeeE